MPKLLLQIGDADPVPVESSVTVIYLLDPTDKEDPNLPDDERTELAMRYNVHDRRTTLGEAFVATDSVDEIVEELVS